MRNGDLSTLDDWGADGGLHRIQWLVSVWRGCCRQCFGRFGEESALDVGTRKKTPLARRGDSTGLLGNYIVFLDARAASARKG